MMTLQDLLDEIEPDFLNTEDVSAYSLTFYSEQLDIVFQIEEVVFDTEDLDVQFGGRVI